MVLTEGLTLILKIGGLQATLDLFASKKKIVLKYNICLEFLTLIKEIGSGKRSRPSA